MTKQALDINDRILKFVDYTGLSAREFERKTSLSNGMINRLKKGHTLGVDKLTAVFDYFPELNSEWVFREKGEMLLQQETSSIKERIITMDNDGKTNITMVDAKASAGFPSNLNNESWYKEQPHFSFPIPELQHNNFTAFEVSGDSMEPTLFKGDWVIGHYLESTNDIRNGYVHVVVSKDGPQVKRLLNRISERAAIVLLSDNDAYQSQQVSMEDVIAIYAVKAKVSFTLKNINKDLYDDINQLQYQILDMQEEIKIIQKNITN